MEGNYSIDKVVSALSQIELDAIKIEEETEVIKNEYSAYIDKKIKDFDNSFKKAVQDAVDAKIKGVSMKASVNNLTSDGKSLAMIKNAEREVTMDPWAKK